MPYKDPIKNKEYHLLHSRQVRGYPRVPVTHCKYGHEFTPENTYIYASHRGCRTCRSATSIRLQKENPEHTLKLRRVRRKDHRAPSDTAESKRKTALKRIGWTPELFNSIMLEQDGKCAVCDKVLNLEKIQNDARACADHEHCIPPKPRGVLCTNCNLGIGNLQDSSEILVRALAYVRRYEDGTHNRAGHRDL